MLDMVYENEVNNSMRIWTEFIDSIKNDIESLQMRKDEISGIEEKSTLFNNILSDAKKIIENKSIFLEIDSSLESEFKKLEFFKDKNNLDNRMAQVALNNIINNKRVVDVSTPSITIKTESESIISKIDTLEGILDNKITPELIVDVAKMHNMTDDEIKQVLFYYVYRTTSFVRLALERDKNVVKKESIVIIPDENSSKAKKANIIKKMYEKEKQEYDKVRTENKVLMSKYSNILKTLKSAFAYINTPNSELYERGFSDAKVAEVVACRLFRSKETVEKTIKLVNNDRSSNTSILEADCNSAIEKMNEFKRLLKELKELDSKAESLEVKGA